jgi:hypothetical protein
VTYDPQTSAACPRTSSDVQLSLKQGSTPTCIPVDNPNGGQIVVKVIAKLKQRERCTRLGLTRVRIESLSASVSTTAGRFKGRVIRNVSHPPRAGLSPCRHRWASRSVDGSPVSGSSSASKCDKCSAGTRPDRPVALLDRSLPAHQCQAAWGPDFLVIDRCFQSPQSS